MIISRKIIFCFMPILFVTFIIQAPAIYAEPNNINAKGAVLVEESSMRVLWERKSNTPLPMASTTKIMTCILALEQASQDEIVIASERAAAAPKVKMYLKPGEKQRLGDLLYALMLQSSNDAAVAIAEHVGGSVEVFCEMMTTKAHALGATSTFFKTANGLDAPGHMSTPYDLALITKYAYENPEFLKIINTPSLNVPSIPLEGSRPHNLQNKNRFLTGYNGANGVKTGYTGLAGHCFVGGAKRDDMQLFAVVLASGWGQAGNSRKYTDTINLLEYGFNNYKMTNVKQAMDKAGTLPVIKGEEEFVTLAYGESLDLPLKEGEKEQISISIKLPHGLSAPVKPNKIIGEADICINGSTMKTLPIITTSGSDKRTIRRSFEKVILEWTNLLRS